MTIETKMTKGGTWHSTGPAAEDGHWRSACPGAECPVVQAGYDTVEPTALAEPSAVDPAFKIFRAGWITGAELDLRRTEHETPCNAVVTRGMTYVQMYETVTKAGCPDAANCAMEAFGSFDQIDEDRISRDFESWRAQQ